MPRLYNVITGKFMFMPDSYVGKYPFEQREEPAEVVVEAKPAPVKRKASAKKAKPKDTYKADAIDGDGDGLVQDGTIYQREAGTELSEEEKALREE